MDLLTWLMELDGDVEKQVTKKLGGSVKLPDSAKVVELATKLDVDIKMFQEKRDKFRKQFPKSAKLCKDVVANVDKAEAAMKKETFKLNPKDKAESKKIDDARKLFLDDFKDMEKKANLRLKDAAGDAKVSQVKDGTAAGLA